MFAIDLAALFFELLQGSEMSFSSRDDMLDRFESLRSYGRLPRGKERRAQRLNTSEIASAILGLVSRKPKFAGHVVAGLENLRTVGGQPASFVETETLREAIEKILTDPTARQSLCRLGVSDSESGTNSYGQAMLVYQVEGARRRVFFVPKEAVSRLQPGAEKEFDEDFRNACVSRETSFNRLFFERVVRALEMSKTRSMSPEDMGEYDAEEASEERYRRLGAKQGSRFLNVGVDNQGTWPLHETVTDFDRYRLVLLPKTKEHMQSISIDLTANGLSDREARTVINRFLSIMAWCDDQYAIAQEGWSGNTVPMAVPRRDLAFTTAYHWIFDRKISQDEKVTRALALYREARNAQQNFMVSYAVLNFYKVVEIGHKGRGDVKNWFRDNFDLVGRQPVYRTEFKKFARICGEEQPHRYIYEACRVAVAHAGKESKSDPDDVDELVRLHAAADVLRILARYFIEHELKVSDCIFSGE